VAFGESGVAAVLTILERKFETIMRQAGAIELKQITTATATAGSEFGLRSSTTAAIGCTATRMACLGR